MVKLEADILTSLNPHEAEQDVLERLQNMAWQAIDHPNWKKYRERASLAHEYYEGDQYTAGELAELEERKQPPSKFNEIKPIIVRMKGQVDELYQTISFLGRNAPDEQLSHDLTEIVRWVDQQNEQEFEESDAIMDALIGGFGVEELDVKRDADGHIQIVERYQDALNYFYPDPYSRHYDWNEDARFVIRAPWMDVEDAVAEWPEKAKELRDLIDSGSIFDFAGQSMAVSNDLLRHFVDRDRKRVRPAEVWYKRKAKRFQILGPDGKPIPLGIPLDRKNALALIQSVKDSELDLEETYVNEMWVGVFAVNVLIHHDRSPHAHGLYPFAPLWCWRKKNGMPYGEVENLMSPQETLNKRESKALHLLSNNQVIAEEGSILDEAEFQRQKALPDGLMVVSDGALTGKRVALRDNTEMGQAQLAMHQNAVASMQRIATATDRDRGLSPEIRSGIGVARQQRGSNLAISQFIKNLRRFRRIKARLKLAYIQQYFTEDLVFQITDNANAPRSVQVGASRLEQIRAQKFDIILVDDTDYHTTRAEEQDKLAGLLPQLAPMGPAWVEVGIALSNLRDKEALIEKVRAINQPPPPAPKINLAMDYGSLEVEERAQLQFDMGHPELAQQLLKDRPDSALLKQIKAKLADTQIKEGTKAMLERGRVDERAAAVAAEGIKTARELDNKAMELGIQAAQVAQQAAQPTTQGGTNA